MKARIYLLSLFLFISFSSVGELSSMDAFQSNTTSSDTCKWLVDNAEWYYTPWSIDHQDRIVKIRIIGDTLIDNRLCSVTGFFKEDTFVEDSSLVLYYDRVEEKVYFYQNDSFKLLYDFSPMLSTGDTLEVYLPSQLRYYDISSSQGDFVPTAESYKYRITNKRSIVTSDGKELRVLDTEPVNETEDCFVIGEIVDGVGSLSGLLGRSCKQLLGGKSAYFRCFKSASMDYSEVNGRCTITSTKDIISENQVEVFYSPTSHEIHIKTELEFDRLRVYDISGRCVISRPYTRRVHISSLTRGVYVLEISGNTKSYRSKILIRN